MDKYLFYLNYVVWLLSEKKNLEEENEQILDYIYFLETIFTTDCIIIIIITTITTTTTITTRAVSCDLLIVSKFLNI